jgi:hypothetical protein
MTTSNEKLGGTEADEKKLRDGEPVWVQCEGFRCLAFRDRQGHWRTFYDRSELPQVIRVLDDPSAQ